MVDMSGGGFGALVALNNFGGSGVPFGLMVGPPIIPDFLGGLIGDE